MGGMPAKRASVITEALFLNMKSSYNNLLQSSLDQRLAYL